MMFFWLITAAVVAGAGSLSLFLLRYVLPGRRLCWGRWLLAAAEGGLLLLTIVAADLQAEYWTGLFLQLVSILLMMQLFFAVLAGIAVLLRAGWRRMLAVPVDRGKRRLLYGAAAFPALAAGAGLYGGFYEKDHTVERHFAVPVTGLDKSLDGYTLAQISDVHLGLFFSLDRLQDLLERVAAARPEALLITGDLFDDTALNERAAKLVDSFTERFPSGIWFCRGNHEYKRGIDTIEGYLRQTRIHELLNEAVCVRQAATPLYFAGVDYPLDRSHFARDEHDFADEALSQVPPAAVTVLLAHHPDFIDDGARHGVRLILTGHTHGGQIGLGGVPMVPPVFKYMRGIYQRGSSTGYVHSGNGSWFPFRCGCPPEIAYFALRTQ
jgi:predicted MPP superfamily phosphohydrolase